MKFVSIKPYNLHTLLWGWIVDTGIARVWDLGNQTVGTCNCGTVGQGVPVIWNIGSCIDKSKGNTTQMLNFKQFDDWELLVGVSRNIHEKHTTIIFWDWPKKPRDMSFGCLNDPSPGFQTGLFPRCPHLLWQFLISTSLAASSLALPISLLICGVFAMALKHWPYPMLGLFTYRHNLRKSSSVNWAIMWNSDVGKQCSVMLANLYPNRNHIFDGWTWCTKNDN